MKLWLLLTHIWTVQVMLEIASDIIQFDCFFSTDEEENAVLVLRGQDRHEYTCIGAEVGGVALDNKNRVVFVVTITHVIKMTRPLSVDMVSGPAVAHSEPAL